MSRPLRFVDFCRALSTMLIASMLTATALLMIGASMVAARPGEWSLPLRFGTAGFGICLDAGVASLLRASTHPLGLRLLDGRSIATRAGVLRLARADHDRLVVDCSPCRLRWPALGDADIVVDRLRVTAARRDDRFVGSIEVGTVDPLVGGFVGAFGGEIGDSLAAPSHGESHEEAARRMTVEIRFDAVPIARWYRAFAPNLPELRVAQIDGRAALTLALELPSMQVRIEPVVEGFTVSGLGTERLAGRLPDVSCGRPSRTTSLDGAPDFGRWLPLAVIAAEDQRYLEHPGYDLDELASSLSRNQRASRIERGASTIPQQLAKLLFVGSQRSATRKLREVLYAVEMERTLGKARMLQLYLALAPWGEGVCGAEAAANHYFGRSASSLAGAQAVWLAAMLHGPDGEAARWKASGAVDLVRATRVANDLRPASTKTRALIAHELKTLARSSTAVARATRAPSNDDASSNTKAPAIAFAGRRPIARSGYRRPLAAGS